MMTLKQFVSEMPFKQTSEILKDFEIFETQGFIGDCALRKAAVDFMERNGEDAHVTIWMNQIAYECARRERNAYKEAYGPLV